MLLYILQHPVAADILLHAASYAVQAAMVTDHGTAKLGNVILKVHQVLGLLVGNHIVKVDILVTPLKVVDDSLIRQFLLNYE